MKEFEEYLNSKIGLTNNKNLKALHRYFTEDQLKNLMDKTIAIVGTNGKTSTANFIFNLLGKEKKTSFDVYLTSSSELSRENTIS